MFYKLARNPQVSNHWEDEGYSYHNHPKAEKKRWDTNVVQPVDRNPQVSDCWEGEGYGYCNHCCT